MSWARTKQSTRSFIFAVAVISLAAIGLWIGVQNNKVEANTTVSSTNAVPAATFAGTGTGNIPEATACGPTPGTPLNVTFNASGLSGSVTSVDVSMTLGSPNHTWMGDVIATLIAPNGASHTVFGRTLATTATSLGDSSDLGGTYVFSDSASSPPSGGWWQEANTRTAVEIMTPGTYRTTGLGGAGQTIPAPPTAMNASFTGVSNANGTWTLRFTDGCTGDTGAVTAAALTVNTAAAVTADANVDFNGDGKTDWVVARGTSTPLTESAAPSQFAPRRNFDSSAETKTGRNKAGKTENAISPPIYWYTTINGSGTTGVGQLGDAATDFLTPEDFDGDGKDDLAVWTPGAPNSANFKILQSTNNTVRVEIFGQDGDDPAVVGDYDGDNKADPAVFRCPLDVPAGQCYFFYRGSNNNPSGNITYVPWGFGVDGDFFPLVGDFDGDGKNDFCLQRANPSSPTNGQFVLLKSNGLGVEYINWGLSSDFLIPGDYDADGKSDICVRRSNTPTAGARTYFLLTRTGATSQVQWGVTGDVSTPGDYDGDGKTDFAIWRGSSTPGASRFWVLNSSNSSTTQFAWGQCPTANTCDFPVAGWAVH
jgi:hypothetical protein